MSKIKSVIIDYNMGNLFSLKCALDFINFKTLAIDKSLRNAYSVKF